MTDKHPPVPSRTTDTKEHPPHRLTTHDLFGSAHRVEILHNGQVYVLQVTRQGKLILTK